MFRRLLLSLSISIVSFSALSSVNQTDFKQPEDSPNSQWYQVYLSKRSVNSSSALNMLQERYASLESSGEKLFISSLVYQFMSINKQPYFGGNSSDASFSALEEKFIQALSHDGRGEYQLAQKQFISLLNEMHVSSDTEGLILFNYQLCRSLNEQSKYHKANFYCSSLSDLLQNTSDPAMPKYIGYRVVANNQYFRGDYNRALKTYHLLLKQYPNGLDVSGVYNDIGNLLRELKQYKKSEEYLSRSLELRANSSKLEQAQVHHSLADLYMSQGLLQKAIEHFEAALLLLTNVSHEYGLAMTNLGLGKAHTQLQDYDRAHEYLVSALGSASSFGHDGIRIETYLALSDVFEAQHLLKEAFHYAYLAKDLAEKVQRNKYSGKTLLQLTALSKLENDFKSAYHFYTQYAEAELNSRDVDSRLAFEALELTKNQYEQELETSILANKSRLDRLRIKQMEDQRLMYNLVVIALLLIASLSFYMNRKIQKKSELDLMTRCLNRAATIRRVRLLPALSEPETNHVLILLDLDNFKLINDTHGHPTGDKALVHIAERVQSGLQAGEFLGRLGGEEFLILLTNVDEHDVELRVNHLHQIIANSHLTTESNARLNVTASFAYLSTPHALGNFDELYSILDQALYQAKKNGRDCIVDAYNDEIDMPSSAY
ncbi:diguanylate cyclase [Vibrio profundi]|uniref:tetratricopeptide repeat-containing diguanylate cyclase n=1 Tax=Vibrio profundi TaxID=1774960 RepID=UPI0037364559